MLSYIWPIGLVIASNILYQICAKSIPDGVSPFAGLTVTYLTAAAVSLLLFFVTAPKASLTGEIGKLSLSSVVLGIVIIGLEFGFIEAYKAGWPVSTASIVQSAFLAVALVFVGRLLYQEPLSWNKLVGVAICLAGLVLINWK